MEYKLIILSIFTVLAVVVIGLIILFNYIVKLWNENKSLNSFTDVLSNRVLELANDISNIKAGNFKDEILYHITLFKATQDTLWEQMEKLTVDNKYTLETLKNMVKVLGAMEQVIMKMETEPVEETDLEPFNYKQARLNQYLTLKQVSKEIGISTSTLSRIENGGSAKFQTLKTLIQFYNNSKE